MVELKRDISNGVLSVLVADGVVENGKATNEGDPPSVFAPWLIFSPYLPLKNLLTG